jgi:uncharacterized protein YjeT (DUF2065 family)
MQGVLFIVILGAPWMAAAHDITLSASTGTLRIAGASLIAAGALIALAGALSLGRNLTPLPHPIDSATLVEGGAYKLVQQRHHAAVRGGAVRVLRHQVTARRALAGGALRQLCGLPSAREETGTFSVLIRPPSLPAGKPGRDHRLANATVRVIHVAVSRALPCAQQQ